MAQLEGVQELKPRMMKALIAAAINSTEYSDLSVDAIYKMFRAKFPDTVNPTKAMEMEERRSLWTTYPNLNKWFDGSKECLIHYGYAEDKPQCVIDIFEGRKPPCEIDCKCCVLVCMLCIYFAVILTDPRLHLALQLI